MTALPPLPAPYCKQGWSIEEIAHSDLFTLDQIRSYALAAIEQERERLAKILGFDKYRVGAAIRKGEQE